MRVYKLPVSEVLLTGVSIWWSVVLFANASFLDGTLPAFLEVITGTEERIWAVVFIVAAVTKVIGLLTMKKWIRQTGLVMSMILYSLITAGYFLSGAYFSTGLGVYFLFTVLAWYGIREVKMDE